MGRGEMGRGETGSSPVTAVFGVAVFLAFVLLATQTLTHLYATSVVTSTVFDAARRAAAEGGGGCPSAEDAVRSRLGDHAADAIVTCSDDGEQLGVHVRTDTPARLVRGIGGRIDREATVRVERPR